MRTTRERIRSFVMIGVIAPLVLTSSPAYAYIDPGTGSMVVQAIAAAILTTGAMVVIFRQAVKRMVSKIFCRHKKAARLNGQPVSKEIDDIESEHDPQGR